LALIDYRSFEPVEYFSKNGSCNYFTQYTAEGNKYGKNFFFERKKKMLVVGDSTCDDYARPPVSVSARYVIFYYRRLKICCKCFKQNKKID
jgi:hypothetical protein